MTLCVVAVLVVAWITVPKLFHAPPNLSAFDGVQPAGPAGPIPADMDSPATAVAVSQTVLVDSLGCGGSLEYHRGSGWPISPHDIVTDDHVIAGSDGVAVQLPGEPLHLATVVLSDATQDVAVLYVPGTTFTPLALGSGEPPSGDAALFIGYPGSNGSNETDVDGTVGGPEQESYNFPTYGAFHTTEDITASGVGPGFSGGPVVDRSGTVIGMVQAGANDGTGDGLALPPTGIQGDVASAVHRTSGVGTGACSS
jgi:S1-C subfamily serine protease